MPVPPVAVTVPPLIVTEKSAAEMPAPFVPLAVTVPVPFVWP